MCFTHTVLPTSTFFFVLADLLGQSFSLAFSVTAKVQDRGVLRTHVASRHLFCGQTHMQTAASGLESPKNWAEWGWLMEEKVDMLMRRS